MPSRTRIKGLDYGADDYLMKSFDVNELLARMRAVIRRQGGQAALALGNGVLPPDPATREAALRLGGSVGLQSRDDGSGLAVRCRQKLE
jgi:two-component system OmpR family response regulator